MAAVDTDNRRLRKRRWPTFLLSWKFGLPLAALLLAASGVMVYRESQLYGLPDIGDPFNVEEFCAIDVPPEENAWPHYEAAGAMLISPPRSIIDEYNLALESGWSVATPAVRQWLEDNSPALERWRTGTEKQVCLRVRPSEISLDKYAGSFGEARGLQEAAQLMALKLEAEGDFTSAWGWHRALFRFSRHRGMYDAIYERLMGNAMHDIAVRAMGRWAALDSLTPEELRSALTDVRDDYQITAPPSILMKYEYFLALDTLSRLDEKRASQILVTKTLGVDSGSIPVPCWLFVAHEPEVTRRLLAHQMASLLPHIDKLPRGRPPLASHVLYFDTRSSADPQLLSAAEFSARVQRSPVAKFVFLHRSASKVPVRELANQSALEVTLAAECYRRVHGELPLDLSQLVSAGILPEVPDDPWSPVPAPLHYERNASDSSRAAVWSVGQNGVNDGGRIAPGDNFAADDGLWIGGEPE